MSVGTEVLVGVGVFDGVGARVRVSVSVGLGVTVGREVGVGVNWGVSVGAEVGTGAAKRADPRGAGVSATVSRSPPQARTASRSSETDATARSISDTV